MASALWLLPTLFAALQGAEPAPSRGRPSGDVDARVQWRFSRDQASAWNLRLVLIAADEGASTARASISDIENQCQSPSSTAAIRLSESGQQVDFISREAMGDGAIGFRVRGQRDCKLAIFIDAPSGDVAQPTLADAAMIVPLSQLLDGQPTSGSKFLPQGKSTVSWTLQRTPGDALRIELVDRSGWVTPGAEFSFSIRGNSLVEFGSQSLFLRYELFRVGQGKVVAEQSWPVQIDAFGDIAAVPVTATAPIEPGVYEIRCSITREEENLWSRLRRRDPPLFTTGTPIVVLANERPAGGKTLAEPQEWKTVGEIRPWHAAAWSVSQWLPARTGRLIPGSEPPAVLPKAMHAGSDVSVIKPGGEFLATLPVATEGMPHKVTLRYPRGRAMRIRVDIGGIDSLDNPKTSFLLIEEEAAHPESQWSSHTFVHYPRVNEQIRLSNLDSLATAAFESISVSAGPSHLSAPRSDNSDRRFAVLQLTDFEWIDSLSQDTLEQPSVASCQNETVARYRLWVAADRLRDYAITNGMNAVSVPAISNGQAWLDCQSFHAMRPDCRIAKDGLDAFLRLMSRGNLKVFVGVDVTAPLTAIEESSGRNGSFAVARSGGNGIDSPGPRYDSLLPSVQAALTQLLGEVDRCASPHPAYAGIVLQVGGASLFGPGDTGTIADGTLESFASSVANDSVSVRQLRSWVADQGKSTFRQWQQSKWRDFYTTLSSSMDGKTLLLQAESRVGDHDPLKAIVQQNSGFVAMLDVRRVPVGSLTHRIDFQRSLPLAADLSSRSRHRAVSLGDSMPPDFPPIPAIRERTLNDVSGVIDQFDPPILFVRSTQISGGLSAALADTLSSFCSLPDPMVTALPPTDPASAMASVRTAADDEHLWLTVANLAPWPTTVDIQCTSIVDWQPVTVSNLSVPQDCRIDTSGPQVSVTLPGGRWLVLKSKSPVPGTAIKSWTSHIAGGQSALNAIKKDVSAIVSRLGMLSDWSVYPALSNGGFEQSGGVGMVGWLHAQHPPDSVLVDSKESVEGNRSALLTTDDRFAGRTWLVSETFAPPESGRLAVSLACRGELNTTSGNVHRLRVSIEGTHGGQPLRETTEFDVPRDGKWQARAVVLQLDKIERSAVQSLRLTIDSLSPGRVWIDDVRLHDSFPLTKERGELQSQAFLAVQGFQRGNLTPSARLLQNHWAKFLLTEAASGKPPTVINSSETHDESDEATPGVAQRIRDWLPRPLRF